MLINRWTLDIKPDREMSEAVDMLLDLPGCPRPQRVSKSNNGGGSRLCIDIEFTDFFDYQTFWAEWNKQPASHAFLEKFTPLLQKQGATEIWRVQEK